MEDPLAVNKRLVRRYFEASLSADDGFLDQIIAPEFDVHAIHGRYGTVIIPGDAALRGPTLVRTFYAEWRSLWRDAAVSIDELIAEGDRVIAQWTFSGTLVGTYLGIAPRSQRVTYAGFNIFRVAGGKLAESWDMMDRLSLFQQLGVLPATREILRGRALPEGTSPSG